MRLTRWLARLRPLAAVLGAAAFGSGAVALFTIDNSAGSLFLVTLGIVLILLAFLSERIQLESFEIFGAKIRVREVVASRLQLAELSGREQDDGRSAVMRKQALTLRKLVDLYGLYEYIRGTEPPSDERTAALDHVAARMQEAGREAEFDPVEVSTWFHEGTEALRVVALNLMLARAEYRDFLVVVEAVDQPRSLFEQFYGLELGRAMLPSLGWLERRLLADAIKRARHKRRFRRDRWLMRLSDAILRELEN